MKATVIILEGPDGSGKTTLANSLEKLFTQSGDAVWQWHYGPHDPNKSSIEEYLDPLVEWVNDFCDEEHNVLIVDRFHIGEMIYGPVLRGASRMSHDDKNRIDEYLEHIGALLLYVRPSRDVILQRFGARGDDLVKVAQLDDIIRRYDFTLSAHRGWATISERLSNLFHSLARFL